MVERLTVGPDLNLKMFVPSPDLRFVGRQNATLGNRFHLRDFTRPGSLADAFLHGRGQSRQFHLLLNL